MVDGTMYQAINSMNNTAFWDAWSASASSSTSMVNNGMTWDASCISYKYIIKVNVIFSSKMPAISILSQSWIMEWILQISEVEFSWAAWNVTDRFALGIQIQVYNRFWIKC